MERSGEGGRNEVGPDDRTDFGAKPPMGLTILVLSAFHFLCCGIPLLLLSGVSLAALFPSWPVTGGILAVLGIVGFLWYVRKGRAARQGRPSGCCPRDARVDARIGG